MGTKCFSAFGTLHCQKFLFPFDPKDTMDITYTKNMKSADWISAKFTYKDIITRTGDGFLVHQVSNKEQS